MKTQFFILLISLLFTTLSQASDLPAALVPLQEKLFQTSYKSVAKDFKTAHPEYKIPAEAKPPVFNPKLSRNEWLDLFIDTLVAQSSVPKDKVAVFKTSAIEMFTSYSRNVGFARVAFLSVESERLAAAKGFGKAKSVKPTQLPESYPPNHTMDMVGYVNERFSTILQDFVKSQKTPLYLHDSNCADAYAFQQSDGFSQAVRFMGARDNSNSQYFFAVNPKTTKFRFAVCDLRGQDDVTRIVALLGPIFYKAGATMVSHQVKAPIFVFNSKGRDFKVSPREDRVVIGFQNTVWWEFYSANKEDWQRIILTDEGTDVSLIENKRTGARIISVENVYGDDIVETLDLLYKKGFRRFVYMGTCGGLDPEFKIGDTLIPNRFLDKDDKIIEFKNSAREKYLVLPDAANIIRDTIQGWVPTLAVETKDYMMTLQKKAQAIDVESLYFAKYFNSHEALEQSFLAVVSDTPLGHMTYEQENATRGIPLKSIKKLVPQIFVTKVDKAEDAKRAVASKKVTTEPPVIWLGPDLYEKSW